MISAFKQLLLFMFLLALNVCQNDKTMAESCAALKDAKCPKNCQTCNSSSDCQQCCPHYGKISADSPDCQRCKQTIEECADCHNNKDSCDKCADGYTPCLGDDGNTQTCYKCTVTNGCCETSNSGTLYKCNKGFGKVSGQDKCELCEDSNCGECSKDKSKCDQCKNTGIDRDKWLLNSDKKCVSDCLKWYTGCNSCDADQFCNGCKPDFTFDKDVKTCYQEKAFKIDAAWKTSKCAVIKMMRDQQQIQQDFCAKCVDGYMWEFYGQKADSCIKSCAVDQFKLEGCQRCREYYYKIGERNTKRFECLTCFHNYEKINIFCSKRGGTIKDPDCGEGTGRITQGVGQIRNFCTACKERNCIDCKLDFQDCKQCSITDNNKKSLYLDTGTKRCILCRVAFCTKCNAADPYHKCDDCDPGFVKKQTDDGQYDTCTNNCDTNCTCNDRIKCITCIPQFGKFTDTAQNNKVVCKPCEDANCLLCDGNFQLCSRCSPGYNTSQDNKCNACDVKFCKIHANNSGWAGSCSCTECADGYTKNQNGGCISTRQCPKGCKAGTCTDTTCGECEDGYGLTRDQKCVECNDKNCQLCASDSIICTKCKDTYNIASFQKDKDHKFPSKGCALKCPNSCFCGAGDGVCTGCQETFGFKSKDSKECQTCLDLNCLECYADFFECKTCKDGHAVTPSDKKCNKCSNVAPCEVFSKSDDCVCEKCKDGAVKAKASDGNEYCWFNIKIEGCRWQISNQIATCIQCKIKEGWFKTQQKQCAKCTHTQCNFCTQQSQCSKCNQGFKVDTQTSDNTTWSTCIVDDCGVGCICNEGRCTQCQPGYGRDDTSSSVCLFCIDKLCAECPGSYKFCSHCKAGYIRSKDDGLCSACDFLNCKRHTSFKYQDGRVLTQQCSCLECNSDFKILNGACIPGNCAENCNDGKCERKDTCFECADKYGVENDKCIACDKYVFKCVDCTISAKVCQHCENGWLLKAVTLNAGGSERIYCIGHCPDGCNCHGNNGKCSTCQFKWQYGPSLSADKKILSCKKCLDSNCQDCRFTFDHCYQCVVGSGHNGKWGHDAKDQSDSNDDNDKCKPCGNPWCQTKHFLDDGSGNCWCKDCIKPAVHIGNACIFPINIIGCNGYYSNYPNWCWRCNNNYRNVRGQCEQCKDKNCVECQNNADFCNQCPEDYISINLGTDTNKKQICVESTCTSSCFCLKGKCISCRNGSGILDREKLQTTDGSYVCRVCLDTLCKRCDHNFIICDECNDGYGYDVRTKDRTFYARKCTRCDINSCIQCDKQKDVCLVCDDKNGYALDKDKFPGSCVLSNGTVANCLIHFNKVWCKTCQEGNGRRDDYKTWTNQCENCAANCKVCENKDICYECNEGYLPNPPAYQNYGNQPNKCEFDCSNIDQCAKCSFNWQCALCNLGYGISTQDLVSQCRRCNQVTCQNCNKDYKYCEKDGCLSQTEIDWIDGICKPKNCPENCKKCEDPHYCQKCVDHYGLNTIQICVSCYDYNCLDCSNDLNICEKCVDNYFLEGDTANNRPAYCRADCSNLCTVCKAKDVCQQCIHGTGLQPDDSSKKDCKICKERLCWDCYKDWQKCCRCAVMSKFQADNSCQTTCQKIHCNVGKCDDYGQCNKDGCVDGTFFHPKSIQCFVCPQKQCKACDYASNKCTACNDGYDLNATGNICNVRCNSNCQYCEFPSSCYICNPEFSLNANGTCEKRNNTDNKVCKNSTTKDSCDECIDDAKYQRKANIKTVDGVQQKQFSCVPICDQNCEFCQDVNKCAHCKSAFSLTENGTCDCTIKNCKICDKGDAEGKNRQCKECLWGFTLEKKDQNQTWCKIICEDYCTCFIPYNCDDCVEGYFKLNATCQPTCKDKNCDYCVQENPNLCLVCQDGFGVNKDTGKCQRCKDFNCMWCGEDYSQCFRCKNNFGWGAAYANNLKCAESEGGVDFDKYPCQRCTVPNCFQCNFDIDHCEFCRDDYYLDIKNNKCVPKTCKIDFCARCVDVQDKCDACDQHYGLNDYKDGCIQCTDLGCVDCHENYSYCNACYDRFGLDSDHSTCKRCFESHCKNCSDNYHDCQECDKGWKWKKGDGENWASCWADVKMPDSCSKQNQDGDCKTCIEGFSTWQGKCFKSTKCDKVENCERCYADNAAWCLECKQDYRVRPSLDKCDLWCDKDNIEELKFCYECKNGKSETDPNKCQKCVTGYRVKGTGCEKAEVIDVNNEEIGAIGGNIKTVDSTGFGLQWWAWLLIVLAVLIVIIVIVLIVTSGKKGNNDEQLINNNASNDATGVRMDEPDV